MLVNTSPGLSMGQDNGGTILFPDEFDKLSWSIKLPWLECKHFWLWQFQAITSKIDAVGREVLVPH